MLNPTQTPTRSYLEDYFSKFRQNIIGQYHQFDSPMGKKRVLYADWTASGRLYQPIEERMLFDFAPLVANTHTETNICGTSMTIAYHQARQIIKRHVNAAPTDCIISYGSGMTGVINKFQRILGLKIPEKQRNNVQIVPESRPVVFVTHMEHHSNQTSWLETICDVEVIAPTPDGLVDLQDLERLIAQFPDRMKIAAITACSNVTGIETPYHEVASLMHRAGGLCFVDFACSAPYVKMDMHPPQYPDGYLDAIYFSPHKFLGGPGTTGVLIFNAKLYDNKIPDNPGGGTVKWTNPWAEHEFIDDIEDREDGGTPPFLQTIRTALCIKMKEEMGIDNIMRREKEMLNIIFDRLSRVDGLHILASHHQERLGVVSFYVENLHYNLGVRLLNDYSGVQVRGGCSCAGTYGHYLLEVDKSFSKKVTDQINNGNLANKPGWIRMSIHPTMTDVEVIQICDAIEEMVKNHENWAKNYQYSPQTNEFTFIGFEDKTEAKMASLFRF